MIFESFTKIFESLDDDYLAKLAHRNPKVLQNMCMFLALDLQLEQEDLKRAKKKSKGN